MSSSDIQYHLQLSRIQLYHPQIPLDPLVTSVSFFAVCPFFSIKKTFIYKIMLKHNCHSKHIYREKLSQKNK